MEGAGIIISLATRQDHTPVIGEIVVVALLRLAFALGKGRSPVRSSIAVVGLSGVSEALIVGVGRAVTGTKEVLGRAAALADPI